jgi:hypothetical protein
MNYHNVILSDSETIKVSCKKVQIEMANQGCFAHWIDTGDKQHIDQTTRQRTHTKSTRIRTKIKQ